jgi:hypothetical protein
MGYDLEGQIGVFVSQGIAVVGGVEMKDFGWLFEAEGSYLGGSLGGAWWVSEGVFLVGRVGMGSISHEWAPSDHSFAVEGTAFPVAALGVNRVWPLGKSVYWGVGAEVIYLYYLRAHDSIGFDSDLETTSGRTQLGFGVYVQLLFDLAGG